MASFSTYAPSNRLEMMAVQTKFRDQTSPLVQITAGALQLHQKCQSGAGASAAGLAALSLPDGRLNVGTQLPLLAKRYHYLSMLGEGVSAQVLLAEDTLRPGRLVVIKVMRRQHAAEGHKEARTLRFLHSKTSAAPGIVRLLDTFTFGGHFCLVLEHLYPRLLDWIAEESTSSSLSQLRKLAFQLLGSVAFMHSHGVVHADLKPDNVLLKQPTAPSMAISLVDFGGAYSVTETDTKSVVKEVQTLSYRAPEVALGCPFDCSIDEWSIGVILAEAALKRPLFPCSTPIELVQAMAAQLGPLPGGLVATSALGQQYDLSSVVMPPPAAAVGSESVVAPQGRAGRLAVETLNELLGGESSNSEQAGLIEQALIGVDRSFADLVMGLLTYDPAKRQSAKQTLVHPFFRELINLEALGLFNGGVVGFGVGVVKAEEEERVQEKKTNSDAKRKEVPEASAESASKRASRRGQTGSKPWWMV